MASTVGKLASTLGKTCMASLMLWVKQLNTYIFRKYKVCCFHRASSLSMNDLPASIQEKMKLVFVNKSLISRRWRAIIILTLIVLIAYFIITYYISRQVEVSQPQANVVESVSTEKEKDGSFLQGEDEWQWLDKEVGRESSLTQVPSYMIQQSKCPACFGTDICDAIDSGDIQIDIPQHPNPMSRKGVYNAKWQGKNIILKTLDNDDQHNFQIYDSFICTNQSLPVGCEVSRSILNPRSVAVQHASFMADSLKHAWKVVHKSPTDLSFAVCASGDLVQALSQTYDHDEDGELGEEEVAMLYTAMIINPEAVLLRFYSSLKTDLPVPEFLGACGRMIAESHGGTPLAHFYSAPFQQRAELALQALEIIHTFIHADPKWFFIFGDFKVENFAVGGDGQLVIVDVEDMAIIDKSKSAQFQFGNVPYNTPCNEACFQQFAEGLFATEFEHQDQYCIQAPYIAGMAMYSKLCRNILADSRLVDMGDLPPHHTHTQRQGLLHSAPSSAETMLEALAECVTETNAMGRIEAVSEITEWLQAMVDS